MFRRTLTFYVNLASKSKLPLHTTYSRFPFASKSWTRSVQPVLHPFKRTMAKRKSSTIAEERHTQGASTVDGEVPPPKRRASGRRSSKLNSKPLSTNPDENANVLDAPGPLRASPDAEEEDERMDLEGAGMDVKKQVKEEKEDAPSFMNGHDSDSTLSEMSEMESPVMPKKPVKPSKGRAATGARSGTESVKIPSTAAEGKKDKKEPPKESQFLDPEGDGLEEADEEEIQAALSRPPPVNSDYLPLPWKGRIGYVYLSSSSAKRLCLFF